MQKILVLGFNSTLAAALLKKELGGPPLKKFMMNTVIWSQRLVCRYYKSHLLTISVNGVSGDGHILMDTGVDTAYLSPPHEAKLGKLVECKRNSKAECLPKGSVIEVFLPNKTNPVACYTFKIEEEEDNLMQPHGVHVLKNPNVFFNSSRHVLGGMNFIYDNTNGYVGYIWNGHSGKHIGYVNPTKIYKN